MADARASPLPAALITEECRSRSQVARSRPVVTARDARQIGKAAAVAIALRLLIGVIKALAKHRLTSRTVWAIRDELVGLDPWKWACVFGGWACFRPLVRVFERLLALAAPSSKHDDTRSTVASLSAAAVVAQPIRVMMMTTRTELALFLASRASHSVASTMILPKLPQPLRDFSHWDVFFVGLSGFQILYSLVFAPNTHSPAYLTFLQNCVMFPRHLWDSVAAYHRNQFVPQVMWHAETLSKTAKTPVPIPSSTANMKDVCTLLHPHTASCNANVLEWIARHMVKFSIPLYLPLKLLTTVIFGSRRFKADPSGQTLKIVTNVLQSSLFLSLYCGGPMRAICLANQLGVRSGWGIALLAGIACSVPTFLEPKSRRLDLALYCNMHAFRALCLLLVQRGVVNPPRGKHIMLLYTVSLAVLFHFLRTRPADLHPNLQSLFGAVVGKCDELAHKTPRPERRHRH